VEEYRRRAGGEGVTRPNSAAGWVVGPQREMIERGERAGAARRKPNVDEVRPEKGSPATAPAELFAS
jgi:hypothetical protein